MPINLLEVILTDLTILNMNIIYLKISKNQYLLNQHPWIYPKAIHQKKACKTGSLVKILDINGQYIATGVYNEHSLYCVRVLSFDEKLTNIEAIIKDKILKAKQLRDLLNLPNQSTNAYRLCNSEADGLSGLTVDIFNDICVIASSAYWVEMHRETILNILGQIYPTYQLIWQNNPKALKQDGFDEVQIFPVDYKTQVLEMGIKFQIDFNNSQKTGLFIDQRENHHRLANFAKDKSVLDLYSYTGGFALHAAKAGASKITAVDSSEHAITQAKINAELNGISNINFIKDDARNYISRAGEYDIVVLDPPKLVPSKQHIERAKNYYRFLHREIFKNMRNNSLLMTCNCSSALNSKQFSELVSTQAHVMGRAVKILGIYGPAICHPTLANFPEGNYLTAALIAVE